MLRFLSERLGAHRPAIRSRCDEAGAVWTPGLRVAGRRPEQRGRPCSGQPRRQHATRRRHHEVGAVECGEVRVARPSPAPRSTDRRRPSRPGRRIAVVAAAAPDTGRALNQGGGIHRDRRWNWPLPAKTPQATRVNPTPCDKPRVPPRSGIRIPESDTLSRGVGQGRSGSGWLVRKRAASSLSTSELSTSHWIARRLARAAWKARHTR